MQTKFANFAETEYLRRSQSANSVRNRAAACGAHARSGPAGREQRAFAGRSCGPLGSFPEPQIYHSKFKIQNQMVCWGSLEPISSSGHSLRDTYVRRRTMGLRCQETDCRRGLCRKFGPSGQAACSRPGPSGPAARSRPRAEGCSSTSQARPLGCWAAGTTSIPIDISSRGTDAAARTAFPRPKFKILNSK